MERKLSLLLILPFCTGLSAQPIIDLVDAGSLPGDVFLYNDCPWQVPGTAGANQIWDFSTLTTDSTITITFVDPATTPDGASFPTATVASDDGGINAYSRFDTTGGYFLGMSIPGEAPNVYSDPMQMMAFPCTYLTNWTDGFSASYSISGFAFTRTGTITANADGYGTMVMPYGTLNDVLRVSIVEDYTDVGLAQFTVHREYTYFLHASTRYPVVDIYTIAVTAQGSTNTITGTHWLVANSTDVGAQAAVPATFRVYPVPATDVLNVEVGSGGQIASTVIELFDASGRLMLRRELGRISSAGRVERIPVDAYEAGLYLLRVTRDGVATTRQVAVQ